MAAYVTLAARCLLGVVFAASSLSKVRSRPAYRAFSAWLTALPVLSAGARRALVPMIAAGEVLIVILLALPWTVLAGLALAVLALAAFTAGTVAVVRRGVQEPCQCFGTATVPLGYRHAVRNAALCAVAAAGTLTSVAPGGPARPAGIGLSLAVAAVAALLVLFLDDLAMLLA